MTLWQTFLLPWRDAFSSKNGGYLSPGGHGDCERMSPSLLCVFTNCAECSYNPSSLCAATQDSSPPSLSRQWAPAASAPADADLFAHRGISRHCKTHYGAPSLHQDEAG